ncbi:MULTISPECIES: amidohydrolase family protein [Enterocloster]|mgnify:FL=1|uniref:5-methylthioadenosine/S-adenosylhomocysteine deaminase n=1 Tax=Enterocloster lavalensis TaxID=460384 RepID=A0A1I0G7W8_9FIRM|nr:MULTISPECIES: amidohydrolase family protein [Enterocloster]MDR3757725.1 amidohydrolase family protein [Enterocloster sp.]SET67047.1 5-methylthioadenosine/S-adenosylhomocysteine deaminase [Enterocloster lavalensis]
MQKCDLLIKGADVLINSGELRENVDIAIADGRILAVDADLAKQYEAGETIDGRYKLFMPGLVDSHMHTGQQLLKGLVLDAKPIIWTRVMLPFESTLTPEKMRLSAQAAALEMIKSGTAGFIDAGSYFMEDAAAVYEKSGLRGALSYSTMDEEGLPESIAMDANEAVRRTDSLFDAFHGKGNLKVYYSLRALNSCSNRLVELEAEHAKDRNTMLQAHMNEYMGEVNGILEREGMRPYEYLEKMQVLGGNFLGAHSLILTGREKELVRDRGVKVCHCPFSNCGKAVPDTPQLLEMGIPVGLGTDGAAHGGLSLWNEMKIFRSVMNIIHGVPNRNPKVMPAETILRMVLEGGAAALGEEGQLGRVEAGYKADLIGIDMNQPHLCPTGDQIHTLLECVNAGDVSDMVVGGRVLMKNRTVLTLDEERILYESRKYMEETKH